MLRFGTKRSQEKIFQADLSLAGQAEKHNIEIEQEEAAILHLD
jgi:hypothetical protein